MFTAHAILWSIFGAIILAFLAIDLGYLNRKPHRVSLKSAAIQSGFWLGISVLFGLLVTRLLGSASGAEFATAYLTEKMLSVDNLFVILLIFQFFKLEEKYYHRVLYWGILGAVLMRGLFIGVGSVLVSHFHWILYIFGAILVWSGIKIFAKKEESDEEGKDFSQHPILKFAFKYLPVTGEPHHGRFLIKEETGAKRLTMLFVVLLLVETTDIIFAIDSIPAVFAITQDPFIVFTSNILAVMGLRALFFLVENIVQRFHLLEKGVALILAFIGLKMIGGIFDLHISSITSFGIILTILATSLILSIFIPEKKKA